MDSTDIYNEDTTIVWHSWASSRWLDEHRGHPKHPQLMEMVSTCNEKHGANMMTLTSSKQRIECDRTVVLDEKRRVRNAPEPQ